MPSRSTAGKHIVVCIQPDSSLCSVGVLSHAAVHLSCEISSPTCGCVTLVVVYADHGSLRRAASFLLPISLACLYPSCWSLCLLSGSYPPLKLDLACCSLAHVSCSKEAVSVLSICLNFLCMNMRAPSSHSAPWVPETFPPPRHGGSLMEPAQLVLQPTGVRVHDNSV